MPTATIILKGFLATALLVLISLWSSGSDDIWLVLIYLAPYAAALSLPAKFTDWASGLVLGAVFVELPFTALFSFFGGIFPDPRGFVLMRVTSVIFVVLALVGLVAHRKDGRQTGRFMGGAFSAVAYIGIAVLVLSSANGRSMEIPTDPKAALGPIHACLALYAKNHGGKYAPNLEELGPNGSRCLDAGLAKGYASNMKITYRPQRESGSGDYSLLMEKSSWFAKRSKSFYMDKSGIIHESFTSKPASGDDRVIENASSTLRSVANCLIQEGEPYPGDVQHFREDPNLICSRQFMENGIQYHMHGTEVHYAPKVDHDIVLGFTLTARPKSYGKDGVRSYFVDETGIVRGTSDDRAAGPNDPPVPACEYNSNPCLGA